MRISNQLRRPASGWMREVIQYRYPTITPTANEIDNSYCDKKYPFAAGREHNLRNNDISSPSTESQRDTDWISDNEVHSSASTIYSHTKRALILLNIAIFSVQMSAKLISNMIQYHRKSLPSPLRCMH